LHELRSLDAGVPLIVMTYANIAYRMGWERFAKELREAGVSAAILPDVPLEESGPWCDAADSAGIETVMLAAPTAPDERLPRICARARGFVYAVGLLGVTGVRAELASSAQVIARRLKAVSERPVVVGVGIGTPEQAVEACQVADGVVVGSAVVQRMLDGGGPEGVAALVRDFRAALDA
jgi:tryptophan synthase alpha chain